MFITIEEYEIARTVKCIDAVRHADCFHLICRHFIKPDQCPICPVHSACGLYQGKMGGPLWEKMHTEVEKARLEAERNGGVLLINTEKA